MANNNAINVSCLILQATSGVTGRKFQQRIERFISKNGVEWTAGRLKTYFTAALLLREGRPEDAKALYQENSISYNHSNMLPKGPEGVIVNNFVHARRSSAIKRTAASLRVYTSLRLPNASKKQIVKTEKAINGDYTGDTPIEKLPEMGERFIVHSLKQRGLRVPPKGGKLKLHTKEIHADRLKATSYYYSRYRLPSAIRKEPYANMTLSFLTEGRVPEALDEVTPIQEFRSLVQDHFNDDQWIAGKITYIQELGAKGRVVCMPSAAVQLAFRPLHDRLQDFDANIFGKESCVMDQDKGAEIVRQHLNDGGYAAGVDLSSATDRFPLGLQLGVLNGLGLNSYADALTELVTESRFIDSETGKLHQYKVGQPMGLYGSFPLFHITHATVVDQCVKVIEDSGTEVKKFPNGAKFLILGDDILLPDKNVEKLYTTLMSRNFGVDVQEAKTHSGDVVEFAGFCFVKTDPHKEDSNYTSFRPLKYNDKFWPDPVSLLHNVGSKSHSLGESLRRKQYWGRQWEAFRKTETSRYISLAPIIPGVESVDQGNPYRGDNSTIKSMSNIIYRCTDFDLPDIDRKTNINRIPLFNERRLNDLYGYNPTELASSEEAEKHPMRRARQALSSDPLIEEIRKVESGKDVISSRLVTSTGAAETGNREQNEEIVNAQDSVNCDRQITGQFSHNDETVRKVSDQPVFTQNSEMDEAVQYLAEINDELMRLAASKDSLEL